LVESDDLADHRDGCGKRVLGGSPVVETFLKVRAENNLKKWWDKRVLSPGDMGQDFDREKFALETCNFRGEQ